MPGFVERQSLAVQSPSFSFSWSAPYSAGIFILKIAFKLFIFSLNPFGGVSVPALILTLWIPRGNFRAPGSALPTCCVETFPDFSLCHY